MDARDELIARIARSIQSALPGTGDWKDDSEAAERVYLPMAEAALSVVETASSTCEMCDDQGEVAAGFGINSPGSPRIDLYPSCGGQPGPLLVLQVLHIEQTEQTYATHVADDEGGTVLVELPQFVQLPPDGWDSWRFPRRQEGQSSHTHYWIAHETSVYRCECGAEKVNDGC